MSWKDKLFNSFLEEEEKRKRGYRYSSGAGDPTVGQQSKPSRGRGVKEIEASKKKGSAHRGRMAGHIKRIRKHYKEHPEDKP
jgi:hypothetical protein